MSRAKQKSTALRRAEKALLACEMAMRRSQKYRDLTASIAAAQERLDNLRSKRDKFISENLEYKDLLEQVVVARSAQEKATKELLAQPGYRYVAQCLARLTEGTTTKLIPVYWCKCLHFCIAKEPGRSAYLNRGAGSRYQRTEWYLLDLRVPMRSGMINLLMGDRWKGKLGHVEGRLTNDKRKEWLDVLEESNGKF